jgi:GH15 family glucan-1,4-alpha-glucosidase
MALRIEDYALIGDTHTAALVGSDGSIDWLCLPRFDSGACFASLLGTPEHGRWLLAPATDGYRISRRYRPGTLVLETEFTTDTGTVRIVDCMPPRHDLPQVVRLVEGVRGRVTMRMELVVRFDYGRVVPWVRHIDGALSLLAGPDALRLHTPVVTEGRDMTTVATFAVGEHEAVPFVLAWHPAHERAPRALDAAQAVAGTEAWWHDWSAHETVTAPWAGAVERSLITLKALTYAPTGGIVAAATTSLPERLGGARNWDYRFCWLRDATFALYALMLAGHDAEARAWRDWLLRAVAGDPADLQIMYGPAGERRLTELTLDWLPGYQGAAPVRVGNAASGQLQLDVYGEVMDAMHQGRRAGIDHDLASWALQRALLDFIESGWRQADTGIWEVRGPRRHFTHSKVMAWVALDRAVKAVEQFGLSGPVDRWKRVRAEIHDEVCRKGYDPGRETFTQSYGSRELDASLLLIPIVGFLPASDERTRGTMAAIQRELVTDGFVRRYSTSETGEVDGMPAGEGAFLACSFWLADNLALTGRHREARAVFEQLLALRNDVGLLAEEYDPVAKRLVGNFPQAFSHVGLINTAHNLTRTAGPAYQRGREDAWEAA